MQSYYNKYKSIEFGIIEVVENNEHLIEREQYWMDTMKPELNLSPTAKNCLGRKCSEETKAKLSLINLGKKLPQWRLDILKKTAPKGDNHWSKRKKFSEEARKNMSDAQKRIRLTIPHPGGIPVVQKTLDGEFVAEFPNSAEAGRRTGIGGKAIYAAAFGTNKTSGGFLWELKR